LQYNGAQVVVDEYAPADVLWFLNMKYIQFRISTMRKYQFGFAGWKEAQNTDDVAGGSAGQEGPPVASAHKIAFLLNLVAAAAQSVTLSFPTAMYFGAKTVCRLLPHCLEPCHLVFCDI